MTRWVQEIKNVMNEATSLGGIEGNLNKRGGLRLQTWQSRWFTLIGPNLSWRDKPNESFPRGEIILSSLTTVEVCKKPTGGEKHVFAIVDHSRQDFKKRREFSCATSNERSKWVKSLQKSIESQSLEAPSRKGSSQEGPRLSSSAERRKTLPAHIKSVDGEDDYSIQENSNFFDGILTMAKRAFSIDESDANGYVDVICPAPMNGYIEKQSSIGIWKKKYFELSENGRLRYFGKNRREECVEISLEDATASFSQSDKRTLSVKTLQRTYKLRCESEASRQAWLTRIEEWQKFIQLRKKKTIKV